MTVASFCTAALLVAALISGCSNWSGFGFDASGPEMPRLKEALALNAGMVVADVGAGKGQLTRALAGTVGPGGHVSALFYQHLEVTLGAVYTGWRNFVAWLHLVLGGVGASAGTLLMAYGGYMGGAALLPVSS